LLNKRLPLPPSPPKKKPLKINSEGDKTRKPSDKQVHEWDLYQTEEQNKSIDANRLMIRFCIECLRPFVLQMKSDLIIRHQKMFPEIQLPANRKAKRKRKKIPRIFLAKLIYFFCVFEI
jgi:hypothetical protein